MKINKDNVVGGIVMLLILAVITWGVMTTVKLNRVAQAHDNLVALMDPIVQQLVQARQQQRIQQPPRNTGSAVPAQVQQPTPEPTKK